MKATLEDLIDVWWKTADIMGASSQEDPTKCAWHSHVFDNILIHCGWTVDEWNEALEIESVRRDRELEGENDGTEEQE